MRSACRTVENRWEMKTVTVGGSVADAAAIVSLLCTNDSAAADFPSSRASESVVLARPPRRAVVPDEVRQSDASPCR